MNDNKQLLVECMTFEPDEVLLQESMSSPSKPFRVRGTFQRKGQKNQNGRIYPDEILIREVQKYVDTFVKERRALGELDHPSEEVVNLKNVSHNVVELAWNGDDLVGTIEVLTNPNGNILRELFKNKIKIGISSRGTGSLKKISESTSMVNDDFNLICFDAVSNPSTHNAFLESATVQIAENIVHNPLTNKWEKTDDIIRNIIAELN